MEDYDDKNTQSSTFSCTSCGADLKYKPGTINLKCDYCGAENDIPQIDAAIEELDFNTYLDDKSKTSEQLSVHIVKCEDCGASSTLDPKIKSASCPYCATPLIISSAHDEVMLQPKSLLPFKLERKDAQSEFRKWVIKLWFAPSDLKKASLDFDHFKGIYIPYWTYDSDTSSSYTGQRGIYYYITETYTTTVNGKQVTKTRQVRKTRWYFVSGRVARFFDDVLTAASKSLPVKYIYALEPWDLESLVPFDEKYLSGFITEKYQIDLKEGFEIAKNIMAVVIRNDIRGDIGGNEQRIFQVGTSYKDITFKHILLPVYVSAYRYKNKLFRFLVNARTGEVQGERPVSWLKITFAAIVVLAIGITIYYFANTQ
ncbi:MAG: hypothetical protein KKD38_08440 [Candidatus Delongbacteria bacterium]|nr:hypothetical protein [Candidatus Delongbacteria bacterium]MCG2760029.1 hypothetical protein [Candidatus Delongbacteria bacterium]